MSCFRMLNLTGYNKRRGLMKEHSKSSPQWSPRKTEEAKKPGIPMDSGLLCSLKNTSYHRAYIKRCENECRGGKIAYGNKTLRKWMARGKSRSAGKKCPICSGARVVEGRWFATMKPCWRGTVWKERTKAYQGSAASHKMIIWCRWRVEIVIFSCIIKYMRMINLN